MPIKESELILNPDGSVYHLNLKPENIANTIIFVGDPDRVETVTKHFDSIEFETQKREFKTQTGIYKGKRLTVLSTGIGVDNIDIVLNELDALVNIDLKTRTVKENLTSLNIIRIGTSGSLQKDISVDSYLMSSKSLDLVGLLQAYQIEPFENPSIEEAFIRHADWSPKRAYPVVVDGSNLLIEAFESQEVTKGITATAGGFYGPQGRILRLALNEPNFNNKLDSFNFEGIRITNLEMETAGIYGLCKLLGHNALSLNAIIANRANGTFSSRPKQTVENLIKYSLDRLRII